MLRGIHPGPQVLVDFRSIFDHNLDPPNPIFRAPAAGRARFIKKSFAAIGTDFGSILDANSFHFPSQNRPKSFQKSIPRHINFLIYFWIDFFIDLGSHFSPQWKYAVTRRPLFCWVCVTFRFFGRTGPLSAQFGLDFGKFGPRFWKFLGFILEVSGHDLGPMCLVSLLLFKAVLF